MATIEPGAGAAARRDVNHEIPLVPFIDFLLCLVSFLLITAVWSDMARLEADALVPGVAGLPAEKERTLHVEMRGERKFALAWREGDTVVDKIDVERRPVLAAGERTYPDLAAKIDEEWRAKGIHKQRADSRFDRAVLHTENAASFEDVAAVLDAIKAPKRVVDVRGVPKNVPALAVALATN